MEINKKADSVIISTDLLSNEVICIHTDGSVDVAVSNDNDEVGNVEHGVETTVQNDDKSPKVFSFEECKAAAEQCEHVGEFILKFTDEYDYAYQNDWLKDLFEKKSAPIGFWNERTITYVARRCKSKDEFRNRYKGAHKRARLIGILDTFDWFIPGRGYYTKEMVFEISHKYTRDIDWMNNKEDSRFYHYAKDNGWLDEMTWIEVLTNKWNDYEKCLAASKQCKSRTEFHKKYRTAYNFSKENGWIDDFDWLKKRYTVDLNKHEHWVYAYIDEENKYVYIGLTREKKRHYQHNTKKNDKGEYESTAKRYFESVNKPLPQPIILKNGLNAEEAQYYEDYFVKKYKSEGWNILNIGATGIGRGALGGGFYKWNDENVTKVAKTCKTLKEFYRNYEGAYKYARDNGLLETFDWIKQRFYKNWTEEQFVEYFNQFNNRTECYADKTSKAMLNFAYNRFELKGVKWYHRRKSFDANRIEKQKAYSRQYYLKKKENRDKPKEDNNE